jgi:hypothetical protein
VQQRRHGRGHVLAPRSRFLPDEILRLFIRVDGSGLSPTADPCPPAPLPGSTSLSGFARCVPPRGTKSSIHSPPAASLRTIGSATVFLLWVSDSLALYARVAVKAIGEVTSPLDLLLSEVKPPT